MICTIYGNNDYRNYLAHYGVKGMKWGHHKNESTIGGAGNINAAPTGGGTRIGPVNFRLGQDTSTSLKPTRGNNSRVSLFTLAKIAFGRSNVKKSIERIGSSVISTVKKYVSAGVKAISRLFGKKQDRVVTRYGY